jgi:hypothetical protein
MDGRENLTRLAAAWVAYHRAEARSPEHEANWWSFGELTDLAQDDPDGCWEAILLALSLDQSNAVVENLSAGPLEDLLAHHGDELITRIEIEAGRNPDFRSLLGGVWRSTISDRVWATVCAVRDLSQWAD